jgi:hypothetical protein
MPTLRRGGATKCKARSLACLTAHQQGSTIIELCAGQIKVMLLSRLKLLSLLLLAFFLYKRAKNRSTRCFLCWRKMACKTCHHIFHVTIGSAMMCASVECLVAEQHRSQSALHGYVHGKKLERYSTCCGQTKLHCTLRNSNLILDTRIGYNSTLMTLNGTHREPGIMWKTPVHHLPCLGAAIPSQTLQLERIAAPVAESRI